MLAVRVAELPAFEQLDSVSRTDEFAKAAAKALAAPIKVAGQLIESPMETTGNIISGIGMMASRAARTAGSAVASVGDKATVSDPQQKQILKPIAAPLGTAAPRQFTGDPLGYNAARREWAQKLKIDAYTSNGALADKLGQVASASFVGALPVNLAVGAAAAPLSYAVQGNATAQLESYQYSPIDIQARNEARLKKMGIEGLPVRTLFRNAYFTPTLQSSLVLALESLGNVPGRDEVIAFAARAASETEARYVINSVSLLAQHNSKVAPLARIRGADNVIAGETRDGKLIIAAPLDYIPWVKPADDFARRADLKGSERWLLISGTVTPRAKQELTTLGWRISDNLATAK
jgi:hypothetical protein